MMPRTHFKYFNDVLFGNKYCCGENDAILGKLCVRQKNSDQQLIALLVKKARWRKELATLETAQEVRRSGGLSQNV